MHDTTRPKIDIITQDTAPQAHVSERARVRTEETEECCAPVALAPHQLLYHFFFPRVFPPLSGCAFVSLVLSKKPIHPHPHPPARPAIDPDSLPARSSAPPWPRRLSPGAAPPPRAMRGNQSQAPHTRAPLRRHLRRLLGDGMRQL